MIGPAVCTPVALPDHLRHAAAAAAIAHNPANHPGVDDPQRIAVLAGKLWRPGTVLTVGFLDTNDPALKRLILAHMNAWHDRGVNLRFVESRVSPIVRVARLPESGFASYLGTDILSIPADQWTMNLADWSLAMPDGECRRVIRHETAHTEGCPHEHMRRELVALLDPRKTIAYFGATQGWSEEMVRQQVLTPLEDASILGTPPDQTSIMCYQIPGDCTRSGLPILGGVDINATDAAFLASLYPGLAAPPPPPPPDDGPIVWDL